jgi:hypothetical protein
VIITIYKLALYYFLIKINFGCSITVDSHVTKVHLKNWCKFLSKREFSFLYLYVVNLLASHVSCLPLIKVDTHFSCEWESRKVSTCWWVIFKSKDPSENLRGFFFVDYLAWCINTRCVHFYIVHTLNSVTKRSNTQLPEAEGLRTVHVYTRTSR